jgi:hypothetical protein
VSAISCVEDGCGAGSASSTLKGNKNRVMFESLAVPLRVIARLYLFQGCQINKRSNVSGRAAGCTGERPVR